MGCIHTHSGPDTGFGALLAGHEPPAYVAALVDAVVEAGAEAVAKALPARLGLGAASADVGRNRRLAGGPLDREVLVLRVDRRGRHAPRDRLAARLPSDRARPRQPALLGGLAGGGERAARGALPGRARRCSCSAPTPTSTRARAASSTSASPARAPGVDFGTCEALGREVGEAVAQAAASHRDARARLRSGGAARARARSPCTARTRRRGGARSPPSSWRPTATARERRALRAGARAHGRLPAGGAPRAAGARAPLPARPHRRRASPSAARPEVRGAGAADRRRAPAGRCRSRRPSTSASTGSGARRRTHAALVSIANGWMRYLPHPRNFDEPGRAPEVRDPAVDAGAGRGRAPAGAARRRSPRGLAREPRAHRRRCCAARSPGRRREVRGLAAQRAPRQGPLVPRRERRLLPRRPPGGRRRPSSQGYEAVVRQLGNGDAVRVVGELVDSPGSRAALRAAGERASSSSGRRSRTTRSRRSDTASSTCARIAHLRPRTNTIGAVLRVRSAAARAIHEFFQARGFVLLHAPIITLSDAEGAGADVRAGSRHDSSGSRRTSRVSGQLEAEIAALALCDVYTFGPTFRAENSNTSRHLAEFWMVEPEMAFCDLDGNAALAEAFLKHLFARVLDELRRGHGVLRRARSSRARARRCATWSRRPSSASPTPRRSRSSSGAASAFEFPVRWGIDLQSEHERWLAEKHVGRPLVVTDYPAEIKAFYMYLNDDDRTVRAIDVLVPRIGEIIGGSQREHRHDVLARRMDAPRSLARALLVVPRAAPLRQRAARRLRPRLRARRPVHDRHGEHPRRDPVPPRPRLRGVLEVPGQTPS